MTPGELQRHSALIAAALSGGQRDDARLVTGKRRSFGLNASRAVVHIPFPLPAEGWSVRSLTCGIALQCAPSKDRIAAYPLDDLSPRERRAVAVVEGRVALGWVARHWAGLLPECGWLLGDVEPADPDMDGADVLAAALDLARERGPIEVHPLLGRLPHPQ